MSWTRALVTLFSLTALLGVVSCGDDDESEADRLGIGAACATTDECADGQECLLTFKGGYCGVKNCTGAASCPEASACVAHDDGINYCFRTCAAKTDCNRNRAVDNESNCSSSVSFVESPAAQKACLPPSAN